MSGAAEPRAAIIGAGLMGRWHADAVQRIGGRVTVIVDPNAGARDELGRRFPTATRLSTVDAELMARHATVAHVCTPLATHETIVTAVLQAGMHALVEKPFAIDAEQTARMLSLASERGLIVCPVHQFVFQNGMQRLLAWLPDLRPIRAIEFATCSAGAAGTDPASLDGLIAEILPHPLSLFSTLLGLPVASAEWGVVHPFPGELRAIAALRDVAVGVAISAHGRPTENGLRVVGDHGSAMADLFHGFAVRHDGAVSRVSKIAHPFVASGAVLAGAAINLARRTARLEPAYPGLRELVRRFYAAARGECPAPISHESTLDVAAARDRIVALLAGA